MSRGFVLLALALAVAGAAYAKPKPAPPAPAPVDPAAVPEIRTQAGPGFRALTIAPHGRLLGAALPRHADGHRDVLLLVAPDEAPDERRVLEVDLGAGGALRTIAKNLPAGLDAIDAMDLDGDGEQEVLLGQPGQLLALAHDGTAHPLAAEGWFDLLAPRPAKLRAPAAGRNVLVTAEAGRVRCFAPAGPVTLRRLCDEALPVSAEREPRGLMLTTPPVQVMEATRAAAGAATPLRIAVGPESLDKRRLRSVVLNPLDGSRLEAWSRLPGREGVEASWYVLVDGQPLLVVATVNADKLSLFEDMKLRIFPLSGDRTRAGRGPSFTGETPSERWHSLSIAARDLDGDGHDDLVLLAPKGLRGKKLVVQALLGQGGGRFRAARSEAELDLDDALATFGDDVTGDGRPDLVAYADGALQIFPGADAVRGVPVQEKPSLRIPFDPAQDSTVEVSVGGGGGGRGGVAGRRNRWGWQALQLVDLDGDGRAEVLQIALERSGRGALRIVLWR